NFLFCKSINGAETTGKIFSIVQSARSNGLKSEKYIAYCLANINKIPIEDLMPYSPNLPKDIYITQKDIQE
ncbi:MAG: transposase domain-containing protein, partial [Erysipelotrichaceae bacterium]|nr:transposase domain-containing protein [Erysipelotrichaceae bacterium]